LDVKQLKKRLGDEIDNDFGKALLLNNLMNELEEMKELIFTYDAL
jgi:hypothetical protein